MRDAAHAPHEDDGEREPIFPPELRPPADAGRDAESPAGVVWRFRVPDGETIRFNDGERGAHVGGVRGDYFFTRVNSPIPSTSTVATFPMASSSKRTTDASGRIAEPPRGVPRKASYVKWWSWNTVAVG